MAHNDLMKPLRSDSLKPRPSTQAVWHPEEPSAVPPVQPPVLVPEPEPEPVFDPEPEMACEAAPVCEPEPVCEEQSAAEPATEEEPHKPDIVLQMEASMAAFFSDEVPDAEEDDEDEYTGEDAVTVLPEPVCVPLYEDLPIREKGHGWLWALLLLAAVAGGGYAAWHFGWVEKAIGLISGILP